ncbi:MAG TPA: T9SS type A sorting domain-containing protein [Lutibacter sp.]|nr:T9SS type A sorting domain-containing protein [Lutibacter sp.]
MIRTYDGGESWELMTSDIAGTNTPGGDPFNALDFFGNKGLMVGQHGEVLTYEATSASVLEATLNKSLKLYPNPVIDVLYIEGFDSPIEEITISNLNGKLIKRIKKPITNQINCSSLKPGIYLFKAILKNEMATKLFIKE